MAAWSGKKVFVTGAGGFIGSHLCESLVKEGADVSALVHYRADGGYGWLDHSPLLKEMHVYAGDVRDDIRNIEPLWNDSTEIVFNLAALISIPYSYHAPQGFLATNAVGTLNMLDAVVLSEIDRFVQMSSSEVYGTGVQAMMDESHRLNPQSPYAASKLAADAMAMAYHASFGVPVVIARAFNAYGPRQSQRALVPSVILQALQGGPIKIAHPYSRRDWTFVDDTVRALMLAGQAEDVVGQVINIGSGKAVAVVDMMNSIIGWMGTKVDIILDQSRERPGSSEVVYLCADASKAKKLLGWEPEIGLRAGINLTIEWFRANAHLYPRAGQFTI